MHPTRILALSTAIFIICGCSSGPDKTLMNKRQADAQRNLGEVYLKEGEYPAALRELLQAEALNPEDHYTHNSLGTVYAARKRLDKAVYHFKKAIELQPDYAPARNNLGSAYLLQEEWDAAIECLKGLTGNLIYATPHYPLANIGWAYYNKKDYRLAESYYQQALDIEPEFARARRGLGLTYMAMGNTDAAVGELEKAVKAFPKYAQAYLDLGRLYQLKGKKDKAIESYQRALALTPEGQTRQMALRAIEELKQ